MPLNEIVYKIFISSPSDLMEERQIIKAAIESIELPGCRLQVILWENDVPSVVTDDAQEEINALLEECDILCGLFKSKFGSKTKRADSGTVEEIELSISQGRPVMLYFMEDSFRSSEMTEDLLEELNKIVAFKKKYEKKGIYRTAPSIDHIIKHFIKKDIEENIKRIHPSSKIDTEKIIEKSPSNQTTESETSPWYMERIASIINDYLNEKSLGYTYIEDLTFHENLLLACDGGKTTYMVQTVKEIMQNSRIAAFNQKYGNYVYTDDLRNKYPDWADSINKIILSTFPRRKKLTLLDIGGNCGYELLPIMQGLSKISLDATVVDISDEAIRKGRMEYSNIKFVQGNMEESYLDGNDLFDVCLCLRAIESRGVFRNDALIQMSKRIKNGGLIFISIPNGYIDGNGNEIKGLYDHRTKKFLEDRPIALAKKIYVKLRDYHFINIRIQSLPTEILVYAEKDDNQ